MRSFSLSGFPSSAVAGQASSFTLTAFDAAGAPATGYRGTVHITSNDTKALLPADYTFTAADAGSHTFTATLNNINANGGANVAVTAVSELIVTTQVPVPEQPPPLHPANVDADAGAALSVT